MNYRKNVGMSILQLMGMNLQVILIGGEIENFGTDIEVEQFLQNNAETQGYEDLQNQTDVDVFKIFAKEQIVRGRNG